MKNHPIDFNSLAAFLTAEDKILGVRPSFNIHISFIRKGFVIDLYICKYIYVIPVRSLLVRAINSELAIMAFIYYGIKFFFAKKGKLKSIIAQKQIY